MNRGLIEAGVASGRPVTALTLPRFMNRGLIEALRAPIWQCERPLLPRFMNRGLIEAWASSPCSLRIGHFPDS